MSYRIALFLVLVALSGCIILDPIVPTVTEKKANELDPARVQPADAAALPLGSRVEIKSNLYHGSTTTWGTVLHTSPQGVALINSERMSWQTSGTPILRKTPYVSRLFKNTGIGRHSIPVVWISIREMSSATVIEPPAPNYVPPQLDIHTIDEPQGIGIDIDFNLNRTTLSPTGESRNP